MRPAVHGTMDTKSNMAAGREFTASFLYHTITQTRARKAGRTREQQTLTLAMKFYLDTASAWHLWHALDAEATEDEVASAISRIMQSRPVLLRKDVEGNRIILTIPNGARIPPGLTETIRAFRDSDEIGLRDNPVGNERERVYLLRLQYGPSHARIAEAANKQPSTVKSYLDAYREAWQREMGGKDVPRLRDAIATFSRRERSPISGYQ